MNNVRLVLTSRGNYLINSGYDKYATKKTPFGGPDGEMQGIENSCDVVCWGVWEKKQRMLLCFRLNDTFQPHHRPVLRETITQYTGGKRDAQRQALDGDTLHTEKPACSFGVCDNQDHHDEGNHKDHRQEPTGIGPFHAFHLLSFGNRKLASARLAGDYVNRQISARKQLREVMTHVSLERVLNVLPNQIWVSNSNSKLPPVAAMHILS